MDIKKQGEKILPKVRLATLKAARIGNGKYIFDFH